uniref:Zinc knuckle CX2CX4HX4C n=1 Tax=Tanacetum cinerariifolium TaxID=118510 RepID=A0A699IE07_TANCI|nr:zinc knuckle CX2CX4HX4C [Tanacetum cinerariifolium]
MYSKDRCEEDGDSKENGDTTNDVINGSCEKGESTHLKLIPTAIDEGREVVILKDDMVIEGCKKWMISLYGHFYGYKMPYAEIRYNLERMEESKDQSSEMFKYLKEQWEAKWINTTEDMEDVYEETTEIARNMAKNVLNGLASDLLSMDYNQT